MGEIKVGKRLWSTYWSNDGQHESGASFHTEAEREMDALRMLRHGWTVAFGDHAGLQEKLEKIAKEYDESQQTQKDRVDELLTMLHEPGHQRLDRPADPEDPLWNDYWAWFKESDPEAWKAAYDAVVESGERQPGLARQEDFNCWKDHRQGILDAWNAWKHAHSSDTEKLPLYNRAVFIETLSERDRTFLQEIPGLLDQEA